MKILDQEVVVPKICSFDRFYFKALLEQVAHTRGKNKIEEFWI